MAGMLSQFSDVQLTEVYRYTTFEIVRAAQSEMAAPPVSTLRVQRLFRSPYLLIEAVADFNQRHSAACIEKLTAIPAAECGDPWDLVGERQLEQEVLAAMRSITRLAIERWNVLPRHAAILADIAASELRQRIREEYESGRDAHVQAIASLRREQASAASGEARPTAKRKQRSNRKAPIDRMLGILETKARNRLERDFSNPDTLHEKMVAEIYGLSAEDLEAPVNEELKSHGVETVSAKTISRSEKYESWRKYRRRTLSPASTATDCGPAFNKPGYRTPTASDAADAEVMASGLIERSVRRLRPGRGSRSRDGRAADQWAKSVGATLPPAD